MTFLNFHTANRQQHFREMLACFFLAFTLHFVAGDGGAWVLPYHLLFLAIFHTLGQVDCFAELTFWRYLTSLTNWVDQRDNAIDLWQCIGRILFQAFGAFLGGVLAPILADNVSEYPMIKGTDWRVMINYAVFTTFFFFFWSKIPNQTEQSLLRNLSFTTLLVAFTYCLQSVAPGAVFGLNLNVFRMIGYMIKDSKVSLKNIWIFIVSPLLGALIGGVALDWVDRLAAPAADAPKAIADDGNYGSVGLTESKPADAKEDDKKPSAEESPV